MKKYPRYIDGETLKSYTQYQGMKGRCSSRDQKTRLDYNGNTLTPEWISYDGYMDWATKQIGFGCFESNGRIWSLDKDILKRGNKHYCPDLCVFVPNALNQFFKIQETSRGSLPLGVYASDPNKNAYKVRLNDGKGKHIYLGTFYDPEEAHEAYMVGKTLLGKELAEKYEGQIDPSALEALSNFQGWYKGLILRKINRITL